MWSDAKTALAGAVFFPTLFNTVSAALRIASLPSKSRLLIAEKLVSGVQAVLAVTIGLMTLRNTSDDIVYTRYKPLEDYVYFSMPYFYYDTWAMYQVYAADSDKVKSKPTVLLRVKGFVRENFMMMVHHLVFPVIYVPIILFARNGKGDYLIGFSFLMETTVPFLSNRYILLELGMKDSILYIINGILVVISFGLARIGLWFFMVNKYAVYKNVPFIEAFLILPKSCISGLAGLVSMNLFWYYRILSIFMKSVNKIIAAKKVA